MPWRRKDRDMARPVPESAAIALRRRALNLEPTAVGLHPSPALPRVFGGVMDMAYPRGVATLVGLADGTTSLYTSAGGGIIGGGEHESVARETRAFLTGLEAHLDEMSEDLGTEVPRPGRVAIYALTYSGRRKIEA